MLRITESVAIAEWELAESFVRASGPGGQNVNKVATAVELRFEAARSPHLSPAVKQRLRSLAGRRWTQDGALLITADRHRSQAMNRAEARERLADLVLRALIAPKPRIPTRPGPAARARRLDAKAHRSAIKRQRGTPDPD